MNEDQSEKNWYPGNLMVGPEGTASTYNFMQTVFSHDQCFNYGEFGFYQGATIKNVRRIFPNAIIHAFDFEDKTTKLSAELDGFNFFYPNSQRYNDSYNWSLMKIIESRGVSPFFDYVFLDGAHTVAIDALTFFLCDKLLKVGGYVDFDDYHWSLKGSSLDPSKVPEISLQYTDEQIKCKQVAMIVDLLVKTDNRYQEIIPNKVYQKIA